MKKSLLALTLLTAVFFSCKKTTTTDFTATDVTGTTTVKGVCTRNVITPNGAGGWINTSQIPAVGVSVQIKVNKNQLYPASIAQGADVYSAVTGTNGAWAMSVKSNATGVQGYVTITGFNGTQDTIINGVTKMGLYANYFGTTPGNTTFLMGTTFDFGVFNFIATNLTSNPNNIMIGSAMVSGSVSARHILKARTTGTAAAVAFGFTNIAIPAGTTVYMSFDKDPTILAPKMYQTTTNANGGYSFASFPTVALGTAGFNQNATIWVADLADDQDSVETINGGAGTVIFSKPGVFGNVGTFQNALYNNEIRNATNMAMNTFTAN